MRGEIHAVLPANVCDVVGTEDPARARVRRAEQRDGCILAMKERSVCFEGSLFRGL